MNAPHTFRSGRIRSFEGFVTEQPDPGVMPSVLRAIQSRPATELLTLAHHILTEMDLGDPDASMLEQAQNLLGQMLADAREADRRQAIMIADGRPSLNPWAAPESGIWL